MNVRKTRITKDAAPQKSQTQLEDLDVERVDGVDRPAHGSSFLILKSEDESELRSNAEHLAKMVIEALNALSECVKNGTSLNKSAAEQLNAVAKLLNSTVSFTVKEEDQPAVEAPAAEEPAPVEAAPTEEQGNGEEGAGQGQGQEGVLTPEAIANAVVKALKAAMEEEEQAVMKSAPPTPVSRQPQEVVAKASTEKKIGSGLFTNIFFPNA